MTPHITRSSAAARRTESACRVTDGATERALESDLYTVAEAGNGYYTVTFSQAGEYYLVAANEEGTIVPAVCTISVSDGQAPGEEVTVTFSLLGDEAHGADGTAHTLKNGNLATWIDKGQCDSSGRRDGAGCDRNSVRCAGGPDV